MSDPKRRLKTVLLVEDNPDDAFLMRRVLERSNLPVALHHVENGLECLNYLRRVGPYTASPRPDLILLDLNMPVMNGREVMAQIVEDDDLKGLPVVVLTTSNESSDREEMYRLRCSSYVRKPIASEEFERVVQELGRYWFEIAEPPPAILTERQRRI